jgi:hypothetical protein
MSCQLHDPAALAPGKEPPGPIRYTCIYKIYLVLSSDMLKWRINVLSRLVHADGTDQWFQKCAVQNPRGRCDYLWDYLRGR